MGFEDDLAAMVADIVSGMGMDVTLRRYTDGAYDNSTGKRTRTPVAVAVKAVRDELEERRVRAGETDVLERRASYLFDAAAVVAAGGSKPRNKDEIVEHIGTDTELVMVVDRVVDDAQGAAWRVMASSSRPLRGV